MSRDDTIGGMIARGAERDPDRLAVKVLGGDELSYAELDQRASMLGRALLSRGLSPGDRVAAWLDTCPDYVVLYVAVAKAGMVIVPINALLTVDEALHQIEDSGATTIVHDRRFRDHVATLRDQSELSWCIELGDDPPPPGTEAFDLVAASGDPAPLDLADPDDLFIIAYTSGTTGVPKGAMLTHRAVKNVCRVDAVAFRLPIGSICAYQSNMSFVATVTALIFVHFYLGGTVVITGKVDVDEFLDVLDSERCTFAYIPTPWIAPFAAAAAEHPDKWTTVRSFVHAASKADPAHVRDLVSVVGDRYLEGWGMTENAGALVTATIPSDMTGESPADDVWGSVGRPVVEAVVRVVGEDGRPLPHDGSSIGELVVRAASLMQGYWRNPEASAAALVDGWYHTGDLGSIDGAGYVYIAERRTDLIVSGGYNVYPSELEHVIERIPGVLEVAVVGLPHSRWGQTPVAAIVVEAGATLDPADVIEHCRRHLASYKKPGLVHFVDELPHTASNKVRRGLVRDELTRTFGELSTQT